jgi:predicted ATPase
MRVALAAHDKVLRTAFESNGGFVFSHTGDGMAAAFASPMSAVDAAIDAQRELQLPVRMGIATGEAELRDDDYFGTVLNRAARVMAAGHGGQILVAESTAGLVSHVELVNLGARRLRDVTNPITLYQLQAPGLQTDFPPLRTLDPSPGNLRRATSTYIGRDTEIADIAAAVGSRRLVTLTGVGGVGKTRLALEVGAQLSDEFPDGVWIFELAAVADPAAVPDAVAAVLGITQQPGKSVTESVAAALEGRARLLLFDNCEHVLDASAELIEAILVASQTVRILATSREGLSVSDEQVWPVRSLDIDAAASLFVERAGDVVPGFSPDLADTVVEVCRRLDGIPLAIELAASRMSSMTVTEVRDRLDDRFRLLVGARRSLERHQTLRHAVAWSYDLLDDAEKSLLSRCSVFSGGFQLESACAVAAFDDNYAALDLLDALVRKSLLVADRSSGRTRFSMLETIREFADEQLVASGMAEQTHGAHASYFAGCEADIMALWDSPQQSEAYTWFFTELANLRAAFRWSADRGDVDAAVTISTLTAFVCLWVETYEPISWVEEILDHAVAANHPGLGFAYTLAAQSFLAGRIEEAVRYSDAGQLVIRDTNGEVPFGLDGWIGDAYMSVGQTDRWVDWCRTQCERDRDTHGLTRAGLSIALMMSDRRDEAMAVADGLIDVADATDNPLAMSYVLFAEGTAFRDADPVRALNALRRGLSIAQDSGNRLNESNFATVLTQLEFRNGDPLAACEYAAFAIRHYHESGNITVMALPMTLLVPLLIQLQHHESAATILGFANPVIAAAFPEMGGIEEQLRGVLAGPTYELLVQRGRAMTAAETAAYAYDQIDQVRTELEQST